MNHYGTEPPWRRYSRWYGEWEKGPELFEGGYVWTWRPPDSPGSYLGLITREFDAYKREISALLNSTILADFGLLKK